MRSRFVEVATAAGAVVRLQLDCHLTVGDVKAGLIVSVPSACCAHQDEIHESQCQVMRQHSSKTATYSQYILYKLIRTYFWRVGELRDVYHAAD